MDAEEKVISEEAAEEKVQDQPIEGESQEEKSEGTPLEETTPTTEETVIPPRKKSAQERIDEITKARREAEREAEYWKKRALEKQQEEHDAPKDTTRQTQETRPVSSQYETVEAYEDALLEWHDRKRQYEAKIDKERQEEKSAIDQFNRNADKIRAEYDDFDEVIETPVFTPLMRRALLVSDNGPLVAYYLGRPENRTVANKIKAMPAEQQLLELGRLETKLILAGSTKKVTSAPAPLTPIKSTGGMSVDESKLSDDEWYELEKKRQKEKIAKKYGGT